MNDFTTAEPFPPCEYIQEYLDDLDANLVDLADMMNCRYQHAVDVCTGKTPIDETVADELALAFGVSSQFWLNMQATYDRTLKKTFDSQK